MLRHSPSFFMELTILIFIFAWASISGAEAFTEVDLSCNFERNFCQWESGRHTDSKFAWIRNKGETITSKTGPSYDHTYQNPNRGYYAYLETSNPLYNRATLESPVIRSNHSHCLRFWYNMNGADVSRLQVVSSTLEILWSKEHNHGNIWLLAEVDIFLRVQQYKISITGYAGDSYEADIAIDDITWEKGLCKNTEFDNLKCNFESGYCGWTNVGFDNFDWTRRSGSTYSINTGPDYDHTLQTPNGYYAYMEASDRHAGEKVILVSRVLNNKRPICFSFWYHMHGKRVGKLLIKVVTKNSTEVLWVKEGSQGQDWKEAKINITTIPREYQIHIVAVCGLDWSSDIAIDDIEINEGSCGIHPCNQNPCKNGRCNIISSVSYTCDCWIGYEGKHCEIFKGYKACESNPCLSGTCVSLANGRRYKCQCPPGFTGAQCLRISNWTCDFKKDFCSWEQSDLDTLDWEFAELENRDRYLSLFNRDGSKGFAIIKSPLLQGNDKLCFKFSYLIVGNTTSLAVTTSFNGKIWSKDGGRINTWRKATITIDKVDRYVLFKIYITALRRRGDGRIALDDVQLLPGKCPAIWDYEANLDCNFQDDFCAWNNAFFDDFDWGRRSGPVTTTSIGAKTSTKLRPDYYAFIDGITNMETNRAVLVSPEMKSSGNRFELTFSYHMYTYVVGTLSISTTYNGVIWTKSGSQSVSWLSEKIPINVPKGQEYQIHISATAGYANLAIDDIIWRKDQRAEEIQSIRAIPNHPRCGIANSIPRIVGGSVASPHSVPWQALLTVHTTIGNLRRRSTCGGSLINENWLITASHCVSNKPFLVDIEFGRHNLLAEENYTKQTRIAKSIFLHPIFQDKYSYLHIKDMDADIALIKLNAPVAINNFVRPICFPAANDTFNEFNSCKISGWGRTAGQPSHILRYADVPILNQKLCNSTHSYNGQITSNMLCAGYMQGYTDACYGDSGGPLSCKHRPDAVPSAYSNRWYLAGVISGGQGCGQKYYPGIYTSVTTIPIYKWLSKILENN